MVESQPLGLSNTLGNLEIRVDEEHGGLRLAGCAVLLASFVAYLLLVAWIVPETGLIGGVFALLAAALTTRTIERILAHRWPSSRILTIRRQVIALENAGDVELSLNAENHINVLFWKFRVPRRTRVPKGWLVLALALEQDGSLLTLYTLIPPEALPDIPLHPLFTTLDKGKAGKGNEQGARTGPIDLHMAGRQRQLLEAESVRGERGAELSRESFCALIVYLQGNFNQWMPRE
jgi:hypothetical protein